MITIRYEREKPELVIQGHAGYAPAGQDIVCAAISGCVYMLMAQLPQRHGMEIRSMPGYERLYVPGMRARRVFDRAMPIFRQIADQYPKNVRVIEPSAGK